MQPVLVLLEVETFINSYGHLPWLTSVSKEQNNVVDMTRMSFETLEAVENMQLQIIELKKENEALKSKYKSLEERIKNLEK